MGAGSKSTLAAALAALLLLASCGGGDETPAGATTVDVRLQEFAVLPTQSSAPAGRVTFSATNAGPADVHELVVIKTDLAPESLPVKADGAVDETGTGITVIGEIEEFAVGTTESVTFDLAAGTYALICNIVQMEAGGTVEVHYKLGMRTAFTVT